MVYGGFIFVAWWYTEGSFCGMVVYGGSIFMGRWYMEGSFLWDGGKRRVHFCGMVVYGGSIFGGCGIQRSHLVGWSSQRPRLGGMSVVVYIGGFVWCSIHRSVYLVGWSVK